MMRILLSAAITFLTAAQVRAADFSQTVRPILSDHCFQCHGPDEKERVADLRLDTEAGIEYAFASGDFEQSEAWRRIQSDDPDERMPPPEFHKSLSSAQIGLLEAWMEAKAPWSQHWAFTPPTRYEPPKIEGANAAVTHPIDRFVVAKLQSEGMAMSSRASRETLIRRLKFDLLGLPPTSDETTEFVNDPSPDAYERLVDRLLTSPHYGERMAVQWLDGARYADTNGYQNDFKRSMWPWRNWVIEAFNENLPYDQFVIEQLAGDLLPDPTLEQRIATGFNRNHRTVTEAGSIEVEWLVENVVDRVETTATVFLGLTMGCARCHDHKYDPISQRDFYQFFSFFHNVKEKGVYQEQRGNVAPLQAILPDDDLQRINELREQLAAAETDEKQLQNELPAHAEGWKQSDLQSSDVVVPASELRMPLAGNANAMKANGNLLPPEELSGEMGWVESVFGTVARFTGLHVLSYGQAIAPDREDSFSFALWVKPEKQGSILEKMDLELLSRGYDLYWLPDGRLATHLIHSWPSDAIKVMTAEKNTVPRNQWTHVTVCYDGSSKAAGVTIYVDGKKVPVKAETDQLKSSILVETQLSVGKLSRGRMFFGSLTDFRYYQQQLDNNEVAAIAHEGLTRLFSPVASDDNDTIASERESLYARYAQSDFAEQLRKTRDEIRTVEKEIAQLEAAAKTVMVMEELAEPRTTYVLTRGEYDKPDKSQPVTAELPAFLGSLPADAKKDRLALAKWMVSDRNPLTARVRVNRIWQMLFGVGLVKTSENFGVQAEAPSHPELLDWLATEFVRLGWDTKALLKLIVTSETYWQSSGIQTEHLTNDPSNRLLTRGPRFRLSAEMIRDNALSVSGLLTSKIGGPSIKPYQPAKLWEELAGGAGEGPYEQSQGEDLYRRSLYVYRKRTVPHPTTSTFDAPSFEICQVARARTNTPLQALALLNDVTYVEAARQFGERMLREGGDSDATRLAYGFQLSTGRSPNERELQLLQQSYERKLANFAGDSEAAKQFLSHGETKPAADLPTDQLAAYASVASILLNLDETITKE